MSLGYHAAMPAADHPSAIDWLATDPAQVALRFRARQAMVAADLFMPADARLRDDDRVAIAGLLTTLVGQVEADLRMRLAGAAAAAAPLLAHALATPDPAIAGSVAEQAGARGDSALVAVLAQRAAERRLVARLRRDRDRDAAIGQAPPVPTTLLATDTDPAIAPAARALAAIDPVGDGLPAAGAAMLPAEVQHRLVWRVAATLRAQAIARHGLAGIDIDPLIAHAAGAALAGYDEGVTPAGLALALARAVAAAGRLDGGLAVSAIAAGEAGFAAALLAVAGGVGFAAAWEMMLDPDPTRLLLLCRAADFPAVAAADIVQRLAAGADDEGLAGRLDSYDAITPRRAAAAISLWRLDPAYLEAIAEIAARPQP
ncbi:DUF2336 domain-containing protein [Sphingomonas solaris]|nr:DUF2336 domain-containing protein [Sphingomonas solaris]